MSTRGSHLRESARRSVKVEASGRARGDNHAAVFEPIAAAAADGRRSVKRGGAGVWLFLLAIGTAGALAHVAVRFEGLEVAYALGRERKIGADLEEQRRRLQIEIGMLKDPNRVVTIARDQLHMGPPSPEAIRRLGTSARADHGGAATESRR